MERKGIATAGKKKIVFAITGAVYYKVKPANKSAKKLSSDAAEVIPANKQAKILSFVRQFRETAASRKGKNRDLFARTPTNSRVSGLFGAN